jgi:hypothetical protein
LVGSQRLETGSVAKVQSEVIPNESVNYIPPGHFIQDFMDIGHINFVPNSSSVIY